MKHLKFRYKIRQLWHSQKLLDNRSTMPNTINLDLQPPPLLLYHSVITIRLLKLYVSGFEIVIINFIAMLVSFYIFQGANRARPRHAAPPLIERCGLTLEVRRWQQGVWRT